MQAFSSLVIGGSTLTGLLRVDIDGFWNPGLLKCCICSEIQVYSAGVIAASVSTSAPALRTSSVNFAEVKCWYWSTPAFRRATGREGDRAIACETLTT